MDLNSVISHFPSSYLTLAVQLATVLAVLLVGARQARYYLLKLPAESAWFIAETQCLTKENADELMQLAELRGRARTKETRIKNLRDLLAMPSSLAPLASSSATPAAPAMPPVPQMPSAALPPLPGGLPSFLSKGEPPKLTMPPLPPTAPPAGPPPLPLATN